MNHRRQLLPLLFVGTLLLSAVSLIPDISLAQDDNGVETLFRVDLADSEYPVDPAYLRLVRIELDGGASNWIHTHPGPEFGFVEAGAITAEVNGPARIYIATDSQDDPPTASDAPANEEFELTEQDLIVYLANTPMAFRNAGSDQASLLAITLVPYGSQRPPNTTYLNGQPTAGAFDGITPTVLGDGIMTVLPRDGVTVVLERLWLNPGDPIPATEYPTLLSLESGALDYEVVSGNVQPHRSATPGAQPPAAPETQISLSQYDATAFPAGMNEVDRSSQEGELVLLRLTLESSSSEASPTPMFDGVATIQILDGVAEEPPGAESPAASPQAGGTPGAAPTPEDQAPSLGEGALVESNSEGVNVRTGAGTSFEVSTQVFTGQQMRITGESEEADGFIWWPVELVEDPSVTGFIADDFIDLVDE